MPITNADLLLKLSTTAGTAGNQNAQADPNASLGKYISTTELVNADVHNLFDLITAAENVASDVEYRCFFIHNNHATLTWSLAKLWILSEVSGGAVMALGLDPAGVTNLGSASAQAATIANESTAPSGVTFSAPTSEGSALSMGNIGPGQVHAIWVRRTAQNNTAIAGDGGSIKLRGETTA